MTTSKAKSRARERRQDSDSGADRTISAGAKILGAIQEATELLRSEGLSSKRLTVRAYKVAPPLRSYKSGDVRRVRQRMGTSQAVLARFLGVNVNTIRAWEQGKRLPQPIACRFLAEIETDPAYWRQRIEQAALKIEAGRPNGRE
jgi:putative transcriptional regulator